MARPGARRAPARLAALRRLGARLRRSLHTLLVAFSILGLLPLAEGVDLVGGGGPVLTSACEDRCDEGCDDAGCHGDLHHCGCCGPMARIAPAPAWTPSGVRDDRDRHRPLSLRVPPERALPPPWQPPRA